MELTGLFRARMVVVTAMMSIVAVSAGDIFDRIVWWLLIAPIVVGAVAVLTVRRRWLVRVTAAIVAVLASTSAIVVITGGTIGDVAPALLAGPQQILSTDWPSPDRGELTGIVAVSLALLTAAAAEAARRARLHLTPLFPVVIAEVVVIALSAPLGLRLLRLVPLAALAVVLATLRTTDDVGLRERVTLLRGERRLVAVGALAIGLAVVTSVPIAFDTRADPRRNEPAERSAAVLDPIEATLALQKIDPPVALHTVVITGEGPDLGGRPPLRWRTAALAEYDGRRWSPDLTLRPIGRRLESPAGDTIDATIGFLDDDLQLVPLPGSPVVVDADIETDPSRTLVRLIDRPDDDTVVDIVARVAPGPTGADPAAVDTEEISDRASGFTDLATGLAAEGGSVAGDDVLAQLTAIERTMSEDFLLRSDVSGGGLQQLLIDRFLRDTRQGNAEQFSTAFVLLARSLGVEARVATGFQIDPERLDRTDGETRFVLESSDARIWPEISVGDQWVAFDPVPENEVANAPPPEPEQQVQTPAAPQPPAQPPPDSTDEPEVTEDDTTASADAGLPSAVRFVLIGAAVGLAWSIPLLLLVAVVLGVKWRRRRTLLSGPAKDRIHGAWKLATMRLVDAGLTIDTSATNHDIAAAGAAAVPTAEREITRLATLANVTTFGTPVRPDLLAEDAATCLGHVETSMADTRDWRQRMMWRLSLRSLRRSTASPV